MLSYAPRRASFELIIAILQRRKKLSDIPTKYKAVNFYLTAVFNIQRCRYFYSLLHLLFFLPSVVSFPYLLISLVNVFVCVVVFKIFYDTNQLLSEKEIGIAPSVDGDHELKSLLC